MLQFSSLASTSKDFFPVNIAQSAGAVEYTNCIFAEG